MALDHRPDQETEGRRFVEILHYAQTMCGSAAGERASLRELAAALQVSDSIVNRYRQGSVHFGNLKAETVRRLAEVCRLQPGTLYVWIRQGRAAAETYERKVTSGMAAPDPSPLELAERLLAHLRTICAKDPGPPQLDYDALAAAIELAESSGGPYFHRLVAVLQVEPVLERVRQREPLSDDDWTALRQLLAADDPQFQQRFYAA